MELVIDIKFAIVKIIFTNDIMQLAYLNNTLDCAFYVWIPTAELNIIFCFCKPSHVSSLLKTITWNLLQVKLWCDCPFWPDDGMCRLRDCSVCECPDSEFPESFKKPKRLSLNDLVCQEGKPQAAVDRTLDSKAFRGWTEIDNPWTNDDETDNGELLSVLIHL